MLPLFFVKAAMVTSLVLFEYCIITRYQVDKDD